MASGRPLPVVFFRTAAGREPAREWLRGLPPDERRIIGEDLKTLQFRWPLGMPLVKSLGGGLRELSSQLPSRIARSLFYAPAGRLVVLHGFIKKTRKTPAAELALARQRKHAREKAEAAA